MWMSSSQRPRRSQPVRSRPRSGSSRCLSSAACHDMFVWSAAALYPFSVSLCVMSRGILCTGSLDVICHASVCGRGVSGVCETCATFWSTKWQHRPRNGSTFALRGLTRKDFSLQRRGERAKKTLIFLLFRVFHCSRCFWCTYWEHDWSARLNSAPPPSQSGLMPLPSGNPGAEPDYRLHVSDPKRQSPGADSDDYGFIQITHYNEEILQIPRVL